MFSYAKKQVVRVVGRPLFLFFPILRLFLERITEEKADFYIHFCFCGIEIRLGRLEEMTIISTTEANFLPQHFWHGSRTRDGDLAFERSAYFRPEHSQIIWIEQAGLLSLERIIVWVEAMYCIICLDQIEPLAALC